MKIKILKYYTVILFAIFLAVNSHAQETASKGYKETLEMNADEKGDMTVISKIVYNASRWAIIKEQHGLDRSVLKNAFIRQFPKYQLTDFDINDNDQERTLNIKFKILGSLKSDENGKWIAELDSKNPNITKISETKFLMVDEGSAQTSTINLPNSASDAKIVPDAFGKAILTYTAPVSGGGTGNIIKWLGFLVAAGGAFLFFKNRKLNTVVVNEPKHQKIDFHQTKKIEDAEVINQNIKENVKHGNNTGNSHE